MSTQKLDFTGQHCKNFLKNMLYFDSFGVQHISKDVKNRSIKTVFQDIYKNKKKKKKKSKIITKIERK